MSKEVEALPKFRRGESAGKPIGGHVGNTPFATALRPLMIDRGFESQKSLANALQIYPSLVGRWLTGRHVPLPERFEKLCIVLQPNDEKMKAVVSAYEEERNKGRGGRGVRGQILFERSRKALIPLDTPLSNWIENFCSTRKITILLFLRAVGLNVRTTARARFGRQAFDQILQNAPKAFSLSEEEKGSLSNAIELEKQKRLKEGKKLQQGGPGGKRIKNIQKRLGYITYNGQEAAEELKVSREWVRQKRKQYDWDVLLTEDQIEILREALVKTRLFRERLEETRKRKRLQEVTLSQ